jgi:hydrogenase large subunit
MEMRPTDNLARTGAAPARVPFRRLPLVVDGAGRVYLRADEDAEVVLSAVQERAQRLLARTAALRELREQPFVQSFTLPSLARVTTGLAAQVWWNTQERRTIDARISQGIFREVETQLIGRVPSDAVHLAGRACGTDSVAHMLAAALALEMACGAVPPPMTVIVRNLAQCGEVMANCIQSLFLLAGSDFAERTVSATTPSLWKKAQQTASANSEVHGLRSIADIMQGLSLLNGHLYQEALQMMRSAREIIVILLGKYPHPTMILPAGVALQADKELFNLVLGRVNVLIDYAKRVTALWSDLLDFFYNVEPRYRRLGEVSTNLISFGLWDDPMHYDGRYDRCHLWGVKRGMTPGVILGGELRTTSLSILNCGLEEYAERAYYEAWPVSSARDEFSPAHPWHKQTIPQAAPCHWDERYSWLTAPRWDCEVVETGPLARLWVTAAAGQLQSEFIRATGRGLEIELPKVQLPKARVAWLMPESPNALERHRARAAQLAYASVTAFHQLLGAFDFVRRDETRMTRPFQIPQEARGVGFGEGSRGVALHHLQIRDGLLANYQISTATNWNASPHDGLGMPGALEAALTQTTSLEETDSAEQITGIDLQRIIRSFDV